MATFPGSRCKNRRMEFVLKIHRFSKLSVERIPHREERPLQILFPPSQYFSHNVVELLRFQACNHTHPHMIFWSPHSSVYCWSSNPSSVVLVDCRKAAFKSELLGDVNEMRVDDAVAVLSKELGSNSTLKQKRLKTLLYIFSLAFNLVFPKCHSLAKQGTLRHLQLT